MKPQKLSVSFSSSFFFFSFAGQAFLCKMSSSQRSALEGAEGVYQENQENMPARFRGANKSRLENQENVNANKLGTRTVLGALANNPRRQSAQRGSKQVCMVSGWRGSGCVPNATLTPYKVRSLGCTRCPM